jgi:anti-sigma B factor antagonist
VSQLLQVERTPGRPPCLAVSGELDYTTASLLDAQLRETICARSPDVTIDVSALEFCDSAGLSVFIGASRRAAAHGGTVTLRGVRSRLRRILVVTGVATMFRLWDEDSLGAGSQS